MEDEANSPLWPAGLDELDVDLLLPRETLRFSDLAERIKGRSGVRVSDQRITAVFRHSPAEAGFQGTVRIRLPQTEAAEDSDDRAHVEFKLFRKGPSSGETGLHVQEFVALLAEHLTSDLPQAGVFVLATLSLPTDRWQSTVQLPISFPGVLDSASGSPEIAGFEFAFRDNATHVHRAAIAIYSALNEYLVRLYFALPGATATDLLERGISDVVKHLRLLASPVVTETSVKPDA